MMTKKSKRPAPPDSRVLRELRETKKELERYASVRPRSDFDPLTDAQYAVLEKASPKARGKAISSLLDTLDAADTAMNSSLEPKDDSPR